MNNKYALTILQFDMWGSVASGLEVYNYARVLFCEIHHMIFNEVPESNRATG